MLYWRRCATQIWVVLLIASTHSRPQLNPISVRYWGVRKRPGIAICTKKLRKSDQEMKTTSITQAAIFVYFIGAHVSGIWVLGKWLTNQTKSPLFVVCSYFSRVTYCPIRSIFIALTKPIRAGSAPGFPRTLPSLRHAQKRRALGSRIGFNFVDQHKHVNSSFWINEFLSSINHLKYNRT